MPTLSDYDLTPGQRKRLTHVLQLLVPDDPTDVVVIEDPPDLPSGWVSATVGTEKGRPKYFDLDEEGTPR